MMRMNQKILLTGVSVLMLAQHACSAQVALPSPVVVQQTVVVVVTPTAQPAPTDAQAPTAHPVVETVMMTAPPPNQSTPLPNRPAPQPNQPTPTPLRLRTARIEGDTSKIRATIVWPDYGGPAITDLVFWVEARNPSVGKFDGAGIKSVDFVLTDSNGQTVYHHTENKSRYCGFGGGEPDCIVFHFADHGFKWPGTNLPILAGDYTLTATVNSADGNQWSGSATISIQPQN